MPDPESVASLDWRAPLASHVLHYWPWPYGDQAKDVGLDAAAVPLNVSSVCICFTSE